MPQANPVLGQAIQDVKESMTDRSKRHLLHTRQRRLNELQKAQLPQEFHAGTPMRPGHIRPEIDLQRQHQAQKPTDYPLLPDPQPPPEAEFWQQAKSTPRDTPGTRVFLERTLQLIRDDRLREIGFNVLDMSGLQVLPTMEEGKIVLKNPATDKVVVLTEDEFMTAVKFIGDASQPPLVQADSKTRELLALLKAPQKVATPLDPYVSDVPWLDMSVETFDTEHTRDMTEHQKEKFREEVQMQKNLDLLRDELEPTRTAQRKNSWKSWWDWMRNKTPAAVGDIEDIVSIIPDKNKRADAAQSLRDMKESRLIDWDQDGQIIDPQNRNMIMKDSNIANVVKRAFSLDTDETRDYLSKYSPTGIDFFIQRMCKAQTLRQRDPNSPLVKLAEKYPGKMFPMIRYFQGKSYSLLKMLVSFWPYLYRLGITMPLWYPLVSYMADITFQKFAEIYRQSNVVGQGNPLAASVLEWLAPAADWAAEKMGMTPETKAWVQGKILNYGDQVTWAAFGFAVSQVSGFFGLMWTYLFTRRHQVPQIA